jgi:hypothetical protein
MEKTIIFYYWLENVITKEKKQVTTFDYLGDVNEISADGWKIVDWTYEMEVLG